MDDVRRRSVVAVVAVLVGVSGLTGGGGGAAAQVPPSSSSTTSSSTSVVDETSTSTTEPPPIAPAPPDVLVTVSYTCVVSGGAEPIPVSSLNLGITNRGGPVTVDIEIDGVEVARSVAVPTSYLGIPQYVLVDLPPGEPGAPIVVELLAAGTDRPVASARLDHRPVCEGTPIGQLPPPATPATPRSARPAFTG
ncbi:MAG: hypothetical protein KF703_10195 [Actinobacteria bacterium]|nr:hypothetical protein [Actinomycetota bacterium]